MSELQSPTPPVPAVPAPAVLSQLVSAPTWHKRALDITVELAGLPALITVIANFFTESQRVLALCAVVGLLAAIALRFFPKPLQKYGMVMILLWILALLCTLVLLLVVVPNRLTEQNKLLANSWLEWQVSLERAASSCAKDTKVEACLVRNLASVLGRRPKPIKVTAITQLASDVVAGQLLLANETTRKVLSSRLGVDERFIGTGYAEPVGSTSAEEAIVSDYLVPNLTESAEHIWVWKVRLSELMDGTPLSDQKVKDVLLHLSPLERADHVKFTDNWSWIERDHLGPNDAHPALIRFAHLDLSSQKPSGCLGRPDATRVFMNGLGDVLDKKLERAFRDSGHTLYNKPDESNVWLFIWVYVPTQEGIAMRATWNNVLNNYTDWIVADKCLAKR